MALYCDEADVYAVVSSGSIPNGARLCASALAAVDVFELDQHPLQTGDPVAFRAEEGGALPGGIAEGTTYYAIRVSSSRFQVSATEGGGAIDLTSDGDLVLAIIEPPMLKWRTWASAWVDQALTGHDVEIAEDAVPEQVRAVAANLAAHKARVWSEHTVSADLARLLDDSQKQLDRWAKGAIIRGTNAPAPANLAVARTVSGSAAGASRESLP